MLIRILIVILSSFLSCSAVANNFEKIWEDLYTPGKGLRDLVFDIESEQIERLVDKKIITQKVEDLKVRYYWIENNYDLEVLAKNSLSDDTKKIIKDEFRDKVALVVGGKFKKFVKGYDYKGIEDNWYIWDDPTKLKTIQKIKIKRNKDQLLIEQYKSTKDKYKTLINLTKTPWSSEMLVIKDIEREIHEGISNVKVKSSLNYTKINGIWLPDKLVTRTYQLLDFKSSKDVNRNIEVTYRFTNYKVNTAEALRWFSVR